MIDVETFKQRYKRCLTEDNLIKDTVISMLQAGMTEREMTDFYTKICLPYIDNNIYKIALQHDLLTYHKSNTVDQYLVKNMTRILAETIAESVHETLEELKKEQECPQ